MFHATNMNIRRNVYWFFLLWGGFGTFFLGINWKLNKKWTTIEQISSFWRNGVFFSYDLALDFVNKILAHYLHSGRDAFVSERLSIIKTLTCTSDVFAVIQMVEQWTTSDTHNTESTYHTAQHTTATIPHSVTRCKYIRCKLHTRFDTSMVAQQWVVWIRFPIFVFIIFLLPLQKTLFQLFRLSANINCPKRGRLF